MFSQVLSKLNCCSCCDVSDTEQDSKKKNDSPDINKLKQQSETPLPKNSGVTNFQFSTSMETEKDKIKKLESPPLFSLEPPPLFSEAGNFMNSPPQIDNDYDHNDLPLEHEITAIDSNEAQSPETAKKTFKDIANEMTTDNDKVHFESFNQADNQIFIRQAGGGYCLADSFTQLYELDHATPIDSFDKRRLIMNLQTGDASDISKQDQFIKKEIKNYGYTLVDYHGNDCDIKANPGDIYSFTQNKGNYLVYLTTEYENGKEIKTDDDFHAVAISTRDDSCVFIDPNQGRLQCSPQKFEPLLNRVFNETLLKKPGNTVTVLYVHFKMPENDNT
ncbi:MAG: hypothetical protein GY874_21505 [Desulfobacteraceae bacterium]|nr:hypothetical protein [Desulfobacteraceae bacterium]